MARSPAQGFGHGQDRARERAGALVLTSLVYGLIIAIALIFRGDVALMLKVDDRLTTIQPTPPKPKPPVKQKIRPSPKPSKRIGVENKRPIAPAPPLLPTEPAPAIVPPIVDLPKTAFADEGPASAAMGSSNQAGSGNGQGGGGAGKGGGSGGTLFNADWQRMPTADEVNRYVPSNSPAFGWGLIACRTIENFRVTDCEIMEEFPAHSGYGQAARAAYRAYRVKPPPLDGRPQIGAWVRIRITYYFPSHQH